MLLEVINKKHIALILLILSGSVFWFMPHPLGLTAGAWHLLIMFIATILGIMLNIMPMGALTLLSMTLSTALGLIPLNKALSGFGSHIVWLVVFAFFIARGVIKTGLGSRLAYIFMHRFGHSTLGLSYALVLTELILAPAIPSSSARGGGVLLPIIESLSEKYGEQCPEQQKEQYKKRIREFLGLLCFHVNVITSTMFITAMAANPITVKLAATYGININWSTWALGAFIPGILTLILLPIMLQFLCQPKFIGVGSERNIAPRLAKEALHKMGKMRPQEVVVLLMFGFLLSLWGMEPYLKIPSTTTAAMGVVLLLLTGTLTWDDILKEKGAWNILVWFAILVMLADALAQVGITKWLDFRIHEMVSNAGNMLFIVAAACIFFFYIHYMFASVAAHVTVMYGTFLGLFVNLGLPPLPSALGLAYLAVLSSGLTHYGISVAPIFFGMTQSTTLNWWKKSFLVTLSNLLIWVSVGLIWWKALGWY